MAGKGTYTAYRQLKPLENNLAENARYAAEVERREAEKKAAAKAAAAQAEAERQAKLAEDFGTDYATLTDVITNNKTIDEAFARAIDSARNKLGEVYKEFKRNPSSANDVDLQMKRANLLNFSKTLADVSQKYTDFASVIAEKTADGTLSSWEQGKASSAESVFAKYNLAVGVDSTGRPIAATLDLDENGQPLLNEDGSPVVNKLDLQSILDGRGIGELVENYDLQKEARELGTSLKKAERTRSSGMYDVTTQVFEGEVEEEARKLVRGYLGSAESPSNIAKSIWADSMGNKAKELTEEDMLEIENKFIDSIRPFYDEKDSQEYDRSAALAAEKFKYQKQRDAKKDSEDASDDSWRVQTDEYGQPEKVTVDLRTEGRQGSDYIGQYEQFSMPKNEKGETSLKTKTKDGGGIVIDRVLLSDDGKTLSYSGYELLGKETGKPLSPEELSMNIFSQEGGKLSSNVTKRTIKAATDPDDTVLTNIAIAKGFEDTKEMKDHLVKIRNQRRIEELTKRLAGNQ